MADKKSGDPSEVPLELVKHPLEHTWNIWLFTNENKKKWIDNLVDLANFSFVEDYWRLFNYMKQPSELKFGQDYAVFKNGISPMWEDEANKNGGRWCINMERRPMAMLDAFWLDLVLLMIGENFEGANEAVCGAVVNVRAKSKLTLWTRTTNQKINMIIGKAIKEQLLLNIKLQYIVHNSNKIIYTC